MANRGVDSLLCKARDGSVKCLQRNKGAIVDWSKPIWVSNILLSEIVGSAQINKNNFNDFIVASKEKENLVYVTIKWMISNGKVVEVDKLYPRHSKIMVCFWLNHNAMKLVVIPSKTRDEILAGGADVDGKYNFPLIFTVVNDKFVSINL